MLKFVKYIFPNKGKFIQPIDSPSSSKNWFSFDGDHWIQSNNISTFELKVSAQFPLENRIDRIYIQDKLHKEFVQYLLNVIYRGWYYHYFAITYLTDSINTERYDINGITSCIILKCRMGLVLDNDLYWAEKLINKSGQDTMMSIDESIYPYKIPDRISFKLLEEKSKPYWVEYVMEE